MNELQYLIGASNMITISHVYTIVLDAILVVYFVLWFFKQPIRHRMTDDELVLGTYAVMTLIANIALLAQILDGGGYKPIAFAINFTVISLLVLAGVMVVLYECINYIRDKIPGDD